jgi:hypothetical protein
MMAYQLVLSHVYKLGLMMVMINLMMIIIQHYNDSSIGRLTRLRTEELRDPNSILKRV